MLCLHWLQWGPCVRSALRRRRHGRRMYSIPLVLLFHTTVRTTWRWSTRLTTQVLVGIRQLPACGPRPERPPAAVVPAAAVPPAEEAPQEAARGVDLVEQLEAPARLHGAPRRFTRVVTRRAKTEPTTRRTGGRRVMIPHPTAAPPEAASPGLRAAAARAAAVVALAAARAVEPVAARVVALAEVAAARRHRPRDRLLSVPTRTSRSA